jgi:hypothetical protein
MNNPFTKHPKSVNESYLVHLVHALRFAAEFYILHLIVIVHAFLPFLFQTTASDRIRKLITKMDRQDPSKNPPKPRNPSISDWKPPVRIP